MTTEKYFAASIERHEQRHHLSRPLPRLRTVFNTTASLQMFWIFLSAVGFSSMLFKLGAMSVWVSVMFTLIKLLAVVAVALLVVVFWQRLKRY